MTDQEPRDDSEYQKHIEAASGLLNGLEDLRDSQDAPSDRETRRETLRAVIGNLKALGVIADESLIQHVADQAIAAGDYDSWLRALEQIAERNLAARWPVFFLALTSTTTFTAVFRSPFWALDLVDRRLGALLP